MHCSPKEKVMIKHSLLLAILCLSAGLDVAARATLAPRPDTLELPCRQKAEQLLDQALKFMEKNYYRRDLVDWNTLTEQARQQLLSADNCDDAYSSISWCFRQLGERHSFVMPPGKAARYTGEDAPDGPTGPANLSDLVGEIRGDWIGDSIGYLTIPWVTTTDSLVCERIADSIQTIIAHLDTRHISRWIIDLRGNRGGNCWPMLTGIGPLLGNGVYGYFVASGERIPFSYYDGSAFQGKHVLCRVSEDHGYHTYATRNSVVVLTGGRTVSAGEIVALAFKGREQTCLIGQPTAGLTTANATYSLSDRSMLVLTVCQEADHNGRICDGSIQPDKYVPAGNPGSDADPARTAAISWLGNK
jgi:C-terminal processing protease CtpA/Prc